ncbi:MAG: tol-pal system-associated acyl-CoA thioesterase [Georgfuchsia sp.]
MSRKLTFRIYYEDTDAGGVVYYANYLRFLERARTEVLRDLGFEQALLLQENRIAFAVRSLSADYLKPARLDDLIEVTSAVEELGRAQVLFRQQIVRQGDLLLKAQVRVACIDPLRGKAVAMPKEIHEKFRALMGTPA